MISEVVFARDFSSFWRTVAPNMEGFVRRLNNGLYDRDYEPMKAQTVPSRRSFVNEIAFEAFCGVVKAMQRGERTLISEADLRAAITFVRENAARVARDGDYVAELSPDERADVWEQVNRLTERLCPAGLTGVLVLKPHFFGCGIVDQCQGDVLVHDTLFEVKAGDRSFRSIDVRQLVTYLALNHARQNYSVMAVGLVNPRIGISMKIETRVKTQ